MKRPWKSKTMWLATVTAGLGALETAAPGVIPAGPVLMGISVLSAMLRVMTTQGIR